MSYFNILLVATLAVLFILAIDIFLLNKKKKIEWTALELILLAPLALQSVLIPAFYIFSDNIPSCGEWGAVCFYLGVFELLLFWPASLIFAVAGAFLMIRRERLCA